MTATTPHTRKAKGRAFQNEVTEILRELTRCHPDDIKPVLMSGSGVDIQVSPALRERFPYAIECKRQENINIWQAMDQAEENAGLELYPAVVFKSNRRAPLICIPFDVFCRLWRECDDLKGGR